MSSAKAVVRKNTWLLPDGVDEVLPPHADRLERLRQQSLALFKSWGYRLVVPPVIEFLESLLSGEDDLDIQTFKVTDQVSGRMMGIRPDITPQVARIDAHRLPSDFPQRLCYIGPVLHTKPDKFAGSRNPLQIGAELYGHAGIESDAEVMCLMADMLTMAGIDDITLELGHMGVFKALVSAADLDRGAEAELLDTLVRKAEAELVALLDGLNVASSLSAQFLALLQLNGDSSIIDDVKAAFSKADAEVSQAIEQFVKLVLLLQQRIPTINLHLDLAELRGYHYHTGVTFAAYAPSLGRAISWGGRYDNVGREFGRPRPATGFSADLKTLIEICKLPSATQEIVFAPNGDSPSLLATIEKCRAAGQIVIQNLPGQSGDARSMKCTHLLVDDGESWKVEAIDGSQ